MGSILKRWRGEESAERVLESLEKQLQKLESVQQRNEQFYQRLVGRLMFYSILLYVTVAVIFYLYCFPKLWRDRIIGTILLLLLPLLILYGIRRILHYVFSSRKRKNAKKLEELRSKKQKVIEAVKEKETYKKAKEILEKFDPDSSVLKDSSNGKVSVTSPETEVRQRSLGKSMSTPNTSLSNPLASFSPTPMRQADSPFQGMSPAMQRKFFINNVPPGSPPGPPKPIPVVPKERSIADKFVDYLVGDGPSNRYALICKMCHSHNGMALMEDFEFTTFRCCYCYNLNEAKKKRPSPPPLDGLPQPVASALNTDSCVFKEDSNHSTDCEAVPLENSKDGSDAERSENGSKSEVSKVENLAASEDSIEQ